MFESLSENRISRGVKQKNLRFVFGAQQKGKYVTVHIPYDIYHKASMDKGDKVDVLVDRINDKIMIKKVNKDEGMGWTLGHTTGESTLKFKYTVFIDCPMPVAGKKESIVKHVEIMPDSFVFDMPDSLRLYSK